MIGRDIGRSCRTITKGNPFDIENAVEALQAEKDYANKNGDEGDAFAF